MSEKLIKRLHHAANGASFDGRAGDAFLMREAAHALSRPAPVQVPAGWKLVPIRATDEMLDNASKAVCCSRGDANRVWISMLSLAAAPSATAAVDPCPQCIPGGTCDTIKCGRKRSSEAMALYGTPAPAPAVDAEKVMALVEEYGDAMFAAGISCAHHERWNERYYRDDADEAKAKIRALLTPAIANQESQDGR